MATQAEIKQWADGIGLAYCVGDEFQKEHQGNLPGSILALTTWGDGTGRRNAAGSWTCKGTGGGGIVPSGNDDLIQQITSFVTENPLLVGGAVVLILLMRRK